MRSTEFVWSISDLNRRLSLFFFFSFFLSFSYTFLFILGTPPSKQDFEQQLHDAVEDISQSRKQPIDLFHILEIFGSGMFSFLSFSIPISFSFWLSFSFFVSFSS